jgi:polyhydroxyalkanoate synthesis regulator phasin
MKNSEAIKILMQVAVVHQQKQLKEQQSQIDELKEMIKSLMK